MALASVPEGATQTVPAGSAAIACNGLSRNFGGLKALRDVTFEIAGGEILGILGPNGAGKSTFINVLSGLIPATSGSVRIHGEDVSSFSMADRARRGLFRTFQNTRPSEELTSGEMLRLASLSPNRRVGKQAYTAGELLRTFGLADYSDSLLSDLPYGVQKMINLAAVALCQPRVLLLDEPFQGVAESEIGKLSEVIRHFGASGVAIGLVEHNVQSVMRLCSRVMVLDSGALIFGGPATEAVRDPKVQEAYLGHRFASQVRG